MTTLTSRKTAREHLATLLDAITDLTVYDHEPKDFGGLSPVVTVHGAGSRTEFPDHAREFHRFWLTWYWRRDDPALTEDYMDDLAQDVRQKLLDNTEAAGYWQDLEFDEEFSEAAYLILDGVQYRSERMRVTVFSVCDNGGIPG
ncbi:MAG: hypothetical protein WC700_16885 [Gemmatimonadaceae bacterium]